MALPTITPSAYTLISFACFGVPIPKPMAHGTSVFSFTILVIAPISVVMLLLTPVTPRDETTYTNPLADFAILAILSFDVGAISGIKSMFSLSQ